MNMDLKIVNGKSHSIFSKQFKHYCYEFAHLLIITHYNSEVNQNKKT
jgi:hypothetical protein